MCQSGPAPGADPATPTVGMEPEDPCAGSRPVEPRNGRVGQGIAVGEPGPGAEADVAEEPQGEKDPERLDPETVEAGDPAPGVVGEDGIACALAVPVSAPVDPAAGGATPESGGVTAVGRLPRTGPYDRLLALAAVGGALVVVGAGAAAAGRRRSTQV